MAELEDLKEGLDRWIYHGILPGSFLQAVLENNLMETFNASDGFSETHLRDLLTYLRHEAPAESHGSSADIRLWARNSEGQAAWANTKSERLQRSRRCIGQ